MTREAVLNRREKRSKQHVDPYPVHSLKRVERPTTRIIDSEVKRMDERSGGFFQAKSGAFGPFLAQEYPRFVSKHPLSGALDTMTGILGQYVDFDPRLAVKDDHTAWGASSWSPMPEKSLRQAPGTEDPLRMARHIKETAYFLRADLVGICKLPPYAVFSNSKSDGSSVELNHTHAIVIVIDQDWVTAEAFNGNDWISNSMSFLGYSHSAFISCILADYIRRLGFPARAHHAMNYQVLVPPLLLWA